MFNFMKYYERFFTNIYPDTPSFQNISTPAAKKRRECLYFGYLIMKVNSDTGSFFIRPFCGGYSKSFSAVRFADGQKSAAVSPAPAPCRPPER